MSDFKRYPRFGKNWGKVVKLNKGKNDSIFLQVEIDGYNFYRYYDNPERFPQKETKDKRPSDLTLRHIFSAFLGAKAVDAILKNATTWAEKVDLLLDALPEDFDQVPMDIFLQWQWDYPKRKDGTEYDKTYLELPRTAKAGAFLVKRTKGYKFQKLDSFDEKTKNVLSYVDGDGNVHPFSRDGWFMASPWANRMTRESGAALEEPDLKASEPIDDDDLPF